MEHRLNLEGTILKAKQSNDETGKHTMPTLYKNYKEKEFTGLIQHLDGIVL